MAQRQSLTRLCPPSLQSRVRRAREDCERYEKHRIYCFNYVFNLRRQTKAVKNAKRLSAINKINRENHISVPLSPYTLLRSLSSLSALCDSFFCSAELNSRVRIGRCMCSCPAPTPRKLLKVNMIKYTIWKAAVGGRGKEGSEGCRKYKNCIPNSTRNACQNCLK